MRAGCSWSSQMPAAREPHQLPRHKVNIDPLSRLHAAALPLPKQNKAQRVPPAPPLWAGSLKVISIKLLGLLGLCWKSNTWEKPWRKRAPAALLLTPHPSLPPLSQSTHPRWIAAWKRHHFTSLSHPQLLGGHCRARAGTWELAAPQGNKS